MSRALLRPRLSRASAGLGALALALAATASLLAAAPASAATGTAPVITLQPQDQTAVELTSVTLTAASDDPTATVNWGVSLDGGTTWFPSSVDDPAGTQSSYTFEAVATRDSWLYHAVFTNDVGSTATDPAKITVTPAPPVVELQPQDTTAVAGEMAYFYSRAWTVLHDHTMQWQVDTGSGTFVDLVGYNVVQESLAFVPTFADSGNRYRALFTSPGGSTASEPATLTVTASVPQRSQDPQDQYQVEGSPVTFEAGALADPMPTVQWQRADSTGAFADVPGATSTTLTVMALATDDYDRFRAVFTNDAGSVTSGVAVLRVWVSPVITQTNEDQTVVEGTPAVFTVHATGNPAPEIRWQVSTDENATWTDIPGATSDSYSTGPTTLSQSGSYYRAIVSNYGDVVVTPYSVLTVTPSTDVVAPPNPDDEPVTTLGIPKAAPPAVPAVPAAPEVQPDVGTLPTTGADTSATTTTGAALLGAGALLVVAGRRRRVRA